MSKYFWAAASFVLLSNSHAEEVANQQPPASASEPSNQQPSTGPIETDADVVLYTNQSCSFCVKAKDFLKAKNIKYTVIEVNSDKTLSEMEKLTGKRTVPQIVVNGKPKGGYKDMFWADMFGKLDEFFDVKPKQK